MSIDVDPHIDILNSGRSFSISFFISVLLEKSGSHDFFTSYGASCHSAEYVT